VTKTFSSKETARRLHHLLTIKNTKNFCHLTPLRSKMNLLLISYLDIKTLNRNHGLEDWPLSDFTVLHLHSLCISFHRCRLFCHV